MSYVVGGWWKACVDYRQGGCETIVACKFIGNDFGRDMRPAGLIWFETLNLMPYFGAVGRCTAKQDTDGWSVVSEIYACSTFDKIT